MIKYPQDKIGIKGNSLTLIKDLNPKYTENHIETPSARPLLVWGHVSG